MSGLIARVPAEQGVRNRLLVLEEVWLECEVEACSWEPEVEVDLLA